MMLSATVSLFVGAGLGAGAESRPGSEVVISSIDDVEGWSVNADGGQEIRFRRDGDCCHSGPASMRVTFAGRQWGNLNHAVSIPPQATAMRLWVRRHAAEAGAVMHVWLMEPDGDGHLGRVQVRGRDVCDWPDGWQAVRVPLGRFEYDPRGNKKNELLSVNRMLLGFNFATMEVGVDDLAWELRADAGPMASPRSASFAVEEGRLGRVAMLDEPGLMGFGAGETSLAGASGSDRMVGLLRREGFGVTVVRAGDLADPQRLVRSNFDLLTLPHAVRFPVDAVENVRKFLQTGGSLLAVGGYAFDEPMVFTGEGWRGQGTVETAAELQAGKPRVTWINTRFGRPGDAMGLEPLQIGMFDPSYPFERVAWAEIGGRRIDGPVTGWAACITDPTGGPASAAANLRFVPLGRTFDRLGRARGPLAGIAHHFAGPYAGSTWGFFGVENRNLLAEDGLPAETLVGLTRRLVDQVYLHSLSTDLMCFREGEAVNVFVSVANRGRTAASGQLSIEVEDRVISTQEVAIPPDKGQSRVVEVVWKPDRAMGDFCRVRATLKLPYFTDELETGFCVWDEGVVSKGRKIALRENYFRIDDRATFLTGTNQTGRMWLSGYENPLVWRDDFAGMRDHGLVLWRVLHFSATMHRNDPLALAGEIPQKVVRQTDAIVQLAQKYGAVLFLTLHDWMPVTVTDDQLAAQGKWNRFWAERYRNVPGILYDIQNEPSIHPGSQSREWTDLKAIEGERRGVSMVDRWIQGNVEPVHSADADALVTVGFLQGMRAADKVMAADHLDFANMHSYEPLRSFPSDFKILDRRAIGKTFSLGEFGAREAHDVRVNGQVGDAAAESIRRFQVTNHYVLGLGGSFTASWCWRDMPDCIFPWGLSRTDHLPKPVLQGYRNLTVLFRQIRPRYEPPGVWLVLPDANRLGGRWGDIDGAVRRVIDVLLGLRVGFGVCREKDVAAGAIVGQSPAVVWSMPYCPDDETFAAVKRFVEAGGALYVSGDLSFDEKRQPSKGSRLSDLRLKLAAHRLPFEVSGAEPVQHAEVGKGKVFFVPYPVELGEVQTLRSRLAEFLTWAGAKRVPLQPEDPEVHGFATAAEDGVTVYNVVNHGQPRVIEWNVEGGTVSMEVGEVGCGLVGVDGSGGVTMLEAQGAVRRGSQLLVGAKADVMVAAMDRRDVAQSGRLLVMASAAGPVEIISERTWTDPVAAVGEIVDGRYKILERMPLKVIDKRLTIDVDADQALALILIVEAGDLSSAAERLGAMVMLRQP